MTTASSVRDLRGLTKREKQLMTSLERIEHFIAEYEAERDEHQLSVRKTVLDPIYKEFYEVRAKIELLLEDVEVTADAGEDAKPEIAEEREKRNANLLGEFEDRYYVAMAMLLEKIEEKKKKSTPPSPGDRSSTHTEPTFSKVKLPEIRLPTFSGTLRDWVTFRDSFRSLIHDNKHLTDMDRFSYLRSGLSGDALREIDSVELSAANYSVAWKALESRYDNKKLIVKAHLDALFAVERLKKESYESLNLLISEYEKNLQMLDKIGEKTAEWSTILAHMLYSRLDAVTLRNWETHHNSKQVPAYKDLVTYLKNYCSVLQSVASAPSNTVEQRQTRSVCHATVRSTNKCPFCSETWHSPFMCSTFQRMQIPERSEAVMRSQLCRNCLSRGHISRDCDRGVCRKCNEKHHTMLHGTFARSSVPQPSTAPPRQSSPPRQPQSTRTDSDQQTHTTDTATHNSQPPSTQSTTSHATTSHTHVALPVTPTQNVLLSTALVRIEDRYGRPMLARALLDSGSQHCLMTAEFASKLQLPESSAYLSVQGIGSAACTSKKLVSAVVGPRADHISSFVKMMQFHVLPRLTVSLPTATFDPSGWNFPESAILADPQFHKPGPVDVIIGAEYIFDLLKNERQKATEDGPTLQNTKLGWIVSGRIPDSRARGSRSLVHVCTTAPCNRLTKRSEPEGHRDSSSNVARNGGRLRRATAMKKLVRSGQISASTASEQFWANSAKSVRDRKDLRTTIL